MFNANLDDFFAKKDKKKSKAKPSYLAANDLYRSLKETAKASKVKELNTKCVEPAANSGLSQEPAAERAGGDENEWSDYNDEQSRQPPVSYSKFKLGMDNSPELQPPEDHVKNSAEELPANSAAHKQEDVSVLKCPWQKLDTAVVAKTQKLPAARANKPAAPKLYVPPSLRRENLEKQKLKKQQTVPKRLSKVTPLDLSSTEYFPSISDAHAPKYGK